MPASAQRITRQRSPLVRSLTAFGAWGGGLVDRARAALGRINATRRKSSGPWLRTPTHRSASPTVILGVAAIIALLVGTAGSLAVLNGLEARADAQDALTHARAIETVLRGGDSLTTDSLQQVQAHLKALAADVARLRGNALASPVLLDPAGAGTIPHVLALAADLVAAGQAGTDAGLVLVPHIGDLFHALSGANSAASTAPPLTQADIARIGADLDAVGRLLRLAVTERASVRDDDLRRLGLASFVPQLQQFDALASRAETILDQVHPLVGALPALLGLATPANYLLLNLDSDELRPGGGFIGNYGILTVSGAHLQSGIALHDIYTLDCPRGCPFNPVPPAFSWLDVAGSQFGLRDANADPDYPASSQLIEQLLAKEGGPQVDGVISITPALIEAILQVTGPISVPQYHLTVDASNLQDELHYFHLSAGAELPGQVSGKPYGTTDRKVIDALLAKNLLAAVGKLSSAQQRTLLSTAQNALQTRDLQVYFNNADAEQVLANFGLTGAVSTPAGGDSLLVVDANLGVNYVNADVGEQIADTVTLDTSGAATHDLTISYTYNRRSHLYDATFLASGGTFSYRDFVRVIVPREATLASGVGCGWASVTQSNARAWGCLFVVRPSQTATLHLRWTVPGVLAKASGVRTYQLYLQRQAGNRVSENVAITAPNGAHIKQPLSSPLAATSATTATFAGELTRSQTLVLSTVA